MLTTTDIGQDVGLDLVDPQAARHRLRCRGVVAGEHHDAHPVGLEEAHRLERRLLHGIGHAHDAERFAFASDEHRRLPFAPQRVRILGESAELDAIARYVSRLAGVVKRDRARAGA